MRKSTVELAAEACRTERGRLALYHLQGIVSQLPSYGLIANRDSMISRKAVLDAIEKAQQEPIRSTGDHEDIF